MIVISLIELETLGPIIDRQKPETVVLNWL